MGWASGFQAGSQVAQRALDAYEKARKERLMAEAAKQTPSITEGAYGPGLEENIEEVRGLQRQAVLATDGSEDAIAKVDAQYNPALAELQRRAALKQADYSLASAGPNYETLQRATGEQGLVTAMNQARVYRELGEPEKAAELEANARRSLAEIADAEYQAKARPLALQKAEKDISLADLNLQEKGYTLETLKQQQTERTNMASYQAAVAALPPDQQNNSQVLVDLATKFKLTTKQQDELIAARAGRSTNEITLARNDITKLIKNKSLDELSELHKTNDMLDPGRHFEVLRDKKGAVTLQMVDSATGKPIGAPAFTGSEAEATKYLYTAASAPETLAEYAASVAKAKLDATKTQSEIDKNKALGAAAVTNAAAAKANATSTENYRRAQGLQKFVNANGDTVILDVAKLPVRDDGTVQIPQGLRPATEKVEPSEAVVQKLAENLIGTPKGGLDEEGKPLVYSASEAYAEAYRTAFAARNPGSVRRAPKTPADILAEEIELRRQAGPRGGPNAVGIDGTQRRMQIRPFEPNQDF